MKTFILIGFFVFFSLEVFAACTMPRSFLPPEVASPSSVTMDGYDWTIVESERGSNIVYRTITRKNFEYIDHDAYITNDQAARIARNFFERNSHILGTPSSMTVAVAGNRLPAVVNFVGGERQYCDGIPVIGTVSGSLKIGEGDEVQVSSLEIEWYVQSNTNTVPTVSAEQVKAQNPGSNPSLALLPRNDDEMLLVWELNDTKGTLIDAHTGKEVRPASPQDKYYKLLFFLVPAITVIVVGFIILTRGRHPRNKKN
jgi:hypothetical protein